ncbi:MAG: hypothetical protein NTY15_03490 [Planctomycetota bacterium]|nr:hypothetical protein [Planctomycetota bacterium]
MRKRIQLKLSILFAFSLAFSGCVVSNTSTSNKTKYLCRSCGDKTAANAKEFITIQGPEIPTKAMLLGQQGLTLNEAIFEWQKGTIPSSIPTTSALFNRVSSDDKNTAATLYAKNIELSLQNMRMLEPKELQTNAPMIDVDRLGLSLSRVLSETDYIDHNSETSIGLLSYLERVKGGNKEQLQKSLESVSNIPGMESFATAALEALQSENWGALSQEVNSITQIQLPAVILSDLFKLVTQNKLSTTHAYSHFVQMPDLRTQFEACFTDAADREQRKNVSDYLSSFDKMESPEKNLALNALKSLIERRKTGKEWNARGLAFETVRDPVTWTKVFNLLMEKWKTASSQMMDQARQTSMKAAIIETGVSLQPFLDERAVILRKSDGSQSIMPMSAVFASSLGGIHLEDGDSISLFRWEQLPLGSTSERYDISSVLSTTVRSRVNWHNVAVVDTIFLGRATQVYFPLDDLHSSSLPTASIIPADASFAYGNFAALPIMIRSQAVLERRLRGEQAINLVSR